MLTRIQAPRESECLGAGGALKKGLERGLSSGHGLSSDNVTASVRIRVACHLSITWPHTPAGVRYSPPGSHCNSREFKVSGNSSSVFIHLINGIVFMLQ